MELTGMPLFWLEARQSPPLARKRTSVEQRHEQKEAQLLWERSEDGGSSNERKPLPDSWLTGGVGRALESPGRHVHYGRGTARPGEQTAHTLL